MPMILSLLSHLRLWTARGVMPAVFVVLALLPTHAAGNVSPISSGEPALPHPSVSSALRPSEGTASAMATADQAPLVVPPKPPAVTAGTPSVPQPSPNAMVNLVNILVSQHVITKDAGEKVIQQAQQEAEQAQAQIAALNPSISGPLPGASPSAPIPATPANSGEAVPNPQTPDDEVRVTYVPNSVKDQLSDEVTARVLKQTRSDTEALVADASPDWVKRFHVTGDLRLRYEDDLFPSGNQAGFFTNFNSINTGSGLNVNSGAPALPQYNVDQNRQRLRLRARLGADIDLADNFTAGIRLATGSDDSPTSENQTLGGVNSFTQGQGGNFGKYEVWLDRAFLRYQIVATPGPAALSITGGRFDNPFFHTSMIWSDDLAFDGVALQGRYQVADGITPFFAGGAFPIFNTELNFSTNNSQKYSSEDKWLYAAQIGVNWAFEKDWNLKVAASYYDFDNVEGKVSSPILFASDNESGDTDDSRPLFAQNGNTYIGLRNYQDSAPGTTQEIQYYGLATPFRVVAATAQLDYGGFDPFHLWLTGEFIDNTAFDRNAIINNGPDVDPGPQNNTLNKTVESFNGGNLGWLTKFNVGKVALEQLWDWNVSLSYRYVQSDATVDGFTDSGFGGVLAGTNLKGYTVGGNLALGRRVWTDLRWMSADAIAGATYHNDVLQFDINAKF